MEKQKQTLVDEVITQTKKQTFEQFVEEMAENYGMTPELFKQTVRSECKPAKREFSNNEFSKFMATAARLDLDPMVGEIYAFPKSEKAGYGIQIIVSIDGRLKIIQRNPTCNGFTTEERLDKKGGIFSITCKMYKKTWDHPVVVTEYMHECYDGSKGPWVKWPNRMLRHKAVIQAARYAFPLGEIIDSDEADRQVGEGVLEGPDEEKKEDDLVPHKASVVPDIEPEEKPDPLPEEKPKESAGDDPGPADNQDAPEPRTPSKPVGKMASAGQKNVLKGRFKVVSGDAGTDVLREFLIEQGLNLDTLNTKEASHWIDKWNTEKLRTVDGRWVKENGVYLKDPKEIELEEINAFLTKKGLPIPDLSPKSKKTPSKSTDAPSDKKGKAKTKKKEEPEIDPLTWPGDPDIETARRVALAMCDLTGQSEKQRKGMLEEWYEKESLDDLTISDFKNMWENLLDYYNEKIKPID